MDQLFADKNVEGRGDFYGWPTAKFTSVDSWGRGEGEEGETKKPTKREQGEDSAANSC